MEKVPMTAGGLSPLQEELKRLKSKERPAVIKAISEAREHGDLSENAEYHAAKDRQGFIEGRISELEDIISRADVIDVSKLSGSTVKFGATVTVADEDTDAETTYQIVGPYEADLEQQQISVQSPIARALIGRTIGDSAEVRAPGGIKSYEIIDVSFG
ncbi:MAG: transcription elongation factor GreA [Rhodospirillaceae bacterium]